MRTGLTVATADMGTYPAHKDALLGALTGTVLEIGAGDGANFTSLPSDIDWIGLEPNPDRRHHLARRAVVSTTVLCSVADQARVLAEVRRVLRASGSFVFFEHVAAPAGTLSRRLQRCWAPISRRLDTGCDPSRDTWRAIQRAGFRDVDARRYTRELTFGIYDPLLGGIAHG